MQTEDFVVRASLEKFNECRRSAEKLKVWPALRPLLIQSLRHSHRRKSRLMEVLDGLSPVEKQAARQKASRKK